MLGQRVTGTLSGEHGEEYWQELIVMNGLAWLGIADQSTRDDQDLYDGKLARLSAPTLMIHGERDPRTEPGELEAARKASPRIQVHLIEGAGHAPHSESAYSAETLRVAKEFLAKLPA